MTNDLDQLLRDTLRGRAATVTDAPGVAAVVPRPARPRRLLVAATVVAVLVAGGGVAVWGLQRGGSSEQSGGGYPRTCDAALPTTWAAALTTTPMTVDGYAPSVRNITPYGDVVGWLDGKGTQHLGLRTAAGGLHSLDGVLRGRTLSGTDVDGHTLLLSIAPRLTRQLPDALVDDLVAVDLRTFATRDVLHEAAVPAGDVVADKAANILNSTVYWVAARGTEDPSSVSPHGTVLAFSLRTGRTRTVGHAPALLTYDDPRGVFWAGGGVSRANVPSAVPPATDAQGRNNPAVSDGRTYAWVRAAEPDVIGWADATGDARSWRLSTSHTDVILIGVSGPFVFLTLSTVRPDAFVLDTRSGALVDSGLESFMVAAGTGSRFVLAARRNNYGPMLSVAVDTAYLPELRC